MILRAHAERKAGDIDILQQFRTRLGQRQYFARRKVCFQKRQIVERVSGDNGGREFLALIVQIDVLEPVDDMVVGDDKPVLGYGKTAAR